MVIMMRRKDREIVDLSMIEKIVAEARYLHLGLFDEEYPYVVPMHYGYLMEADKLTFYVHCAKEGHKLDCISKNNKVFVEIAKGEKLVTADTPCMYGAEYESVMCRGTATIVNDVKEKMNALEILMKTQTKEVFHFNESMVEAVHVIRIDVDSYSAKARLS